MKDLKQKKLTYDAAEELNLEIVTQRNENGALVKENRSLKEELRNTLKRYE